MPARPARWAEPARALPDETRGALARAGIDRLYTHQAQALDRVHAGEHVIVATGTASGKSLCYHLPVLEAFASDPRATALYLFPTKALAQDQLRSLSHLAAGLAEPPMARIFDGDTPREDRGRIKKQARLILSNPDMLHLGVLPNHAAWSTFLRRLRFVVVDEAHVYRGVFGSQVANVLRRLRRLCRLYGSRPQFIFCSATIANPGELAERLIGEPAAVVDDDGAPYGGKEFVFWNPPLVDPILQRRRSANSEATVLFAELVRSGVRTIAFAKTRRVAELIFVYARDRLAEKDPDLLKRISPYRAGYLATDRRSIERGLFAGELLGVTATTALELGVDVGDLDATILTGYPGTIASTWQQAGRSGRRLGRSLSVLIGLDNPLDQYLMRHPEAFFGRPHEHALIDPANPVVRESHLLCAAYEAPLSAADGEWFGAELPEVADDLASRGYLVRRNDRWYLPAAVSYPAQEVNIRSTSGQPFALIDAASGRVIETVEPATTFLQAHPGAVYLHRGETFLVERLDLTVRTAWLRQTEVNYYTQSIDLTDISIVHTGRERQAGNVQASFGRVSVTSQVVGFKRKQQFSDELLGQEPLNLPPQQFETAALWFDVPAPIAQAIEQAGLDFLGGIHALEHAMIGLLPLLAMCDRRDIGGLSTALHPQTGRPQIFIYDGHPGGIGIAEKGYELLEELWARTLEAIAECRCEDGCPSCIHSPKCGNNNEPLDKEAARRVLEMVKVCP